MLKSEFCQLASLAVPQLLHALSLSNGADIFWNLINSNFNSKDWKIRFEAGKKPTCRCFFLFITVSEISLLSLYTDTYTELESLAII